MTLFRWTLGGPPHETHADVTSARIAAVLVRKTPCAAVARPRGSRPLRLGRSPCCRSSGSGRTATAGPLTSTYAVSTLLPEPLGRMRARPPLTFFPNSRHLSSFVNISSRWQIMSTKNKKNGQRRSFYK